MNASPDRTAFKQQEEAAMLERLKRAVADVMEPGDEQHAVYRVAEVRCVSEARLRAELERLGWTPPKLIRQRRSRAKQPPRARSDNQT